MQSRGRRPTECWGWAGVCGGGFQTRYGIPWWFSCSLSLARALEGRWVAAAATTQDGGTHGLWRERCIRTAAGSSRATATPPGGDLLEAPCDGDGGCRGACCKALARGGDWRGATGPAAMGHSGAVRGSAKRVNEALQKREKRARTSLHL